MIEETLCPECGGRMQSRINRNTGQRFWGCKRYPVCKGTRNTDGEIVTRQSVRDFSDEPASPSDRQRENDRSRWRNQ